MGLLVPITKPTSTSTGVIMLFIRVVKLNEADETDRTFSRLTIPKPKEVVINDSPRNLLRAARSLCSCSWVQRQVLDLLSKRISRSLLNHGGLPVGSLMNMRPWQLVWLESGFIALEKT